jgi:uncharacterized cofD-like protein
MKEIVCLGGGNAMPKAVLSGLKHYPVKISAVCAMLDSGGSSGRLRKNYGVLAPGDIRRALIVLSQVKPEIKKLLNYRFEKGPLKNHNFANILISALELSNKNFIKGFNAFKKLLNLKHNVLPITTQKSHLFAELINGKIIKGEANIDKPKHNGNIPIKRVFLKPKPKAFPPALKIIKKADAIIIGPGDLYSSLAQILLTQGIKKAIKESKALKIYLCNLMTKYGETNNFSVLDFTSQVEEWLGQKLDIVLYNNFIPSLKRLNLYRKKHPELLDLVEIDKNLDPKKFKGENLIYDRGPIEHDPKKVAKNIMKLIKNT